MEINHTYILKKILCYFLGISVINLKFIFYENNSQLVDNRIGITHEYRISQLAPTGSSIATEGNLNVVLQNIVITDSSTQQNATFSI